MPSYKESSGDYDLAEVRDVALKSCFGLIPGEPFTATLKLSQKEFPVVGSFTPDAERVSGWILPTGEYDSLIQELLPTLHRINPAAAELSFRGYNNSEALLPIRVTTLPMGEHYYLWPRRPPIQVRAIFSDWPGNGGRWFDYAKVGIQGLPFLLPNARTHKVMRTWEYSDGTKLMDGGEWTQWGGVKLAADGWRLELRGTQSGGGDQPYSYSYSYTGEIRRDDREPFPISRLEIFLGRVELFLSVYANRRRHFAVVGASRSIRPYGGFYSRWASYRCRLMSGSIEYQPIWALGVVNASNEDTWLALFLEFYRCCANPVFEEAVRNYVEAGEHLLLNPVASFVDVWGAMERLCQSFGYNRDFEPGYLLRIIKRHRQALAELENPYQYAIKNNREEASFLKSFYDTRNDCAHGRLPLGNQKVNRAQRWWAGSLNGGEESELMKEQPAYDPKSLFRFIRLVRALMMVRLKGLKCPDTGSDDSGWGKIPGNS